MEDRGRTGQEDEENMRVGFYNISKCRGSDEMRSTILV
jgi:hypothetical protein